MHLRIPAVVVTSWVGRAIHQVEDAKQRRGELLRVSRAESAKHAKEMAEERRQTVRAVRDAEKTAARLHKAQEAQAKSEQMLRLKHEEVSSALRRIKEQQKALTGQGSAVAVPAGAGDSGTKNGPNPATEAAGRGALAGLRKWVEHEFNMDVAVASCRQLLAATMAERAELQRKLDAVGLALGGAVDAAMAAFGGEEDDLLAFVGEDEACRAMQDEAAALEALAASKSRDIEELQEGVLGACDEDGKKGESRWGKVKSLSEAKELLGHLFDLAVSRRVEANERRQAAEQRAQADVDAALEDQQRRHDDDLRQLRREMTEKMVLLLQASATSTSLSPISEADEEDAQGPPSAAAELARLRSWQESATAELADSRDQLEKAQHEVPRGKSINRRNKRKRTL
jgi:kinesin family protein 4/21/27